VGRAWVLDTDTKGTGAQMVPLEKVLRQPGDEPEVRRPVARPEPRPRPAPEPAPREPRRFKVVDVMTCQVLAEGADARATTELLGEVRSIVDVSIYAWEPNDEDWRLLTNREKKVVWARRGAQRRQRRAPESSVRPSTATKA
jgi:hypothetical protein